MNYSEKRPKKEVSFKLDITEPLRVNFPLMKGSLDLDDKTRIIFVHDFQYIWANLVSVNTRKTQFSLGGMSTS